MRLAFLAAVVFSACSALAQQATAPLRTVPQAPAGAVQAALPDDPSYLATVRPLDDGLFSSSNPQPVGTFSLYPASHLPQQTAAEAAAQSDHGKPAPGQEVDANGNIIPLDRRQPKRILGFMPNFRSVSAGAVVPPPGWKYNFKIATRQSFDYSSFIFLGLTSASAYGMDSHPSLDKGSFPFYAYLWRGFLDKTDGTYLGGFFYPSLLHEDNRYYPLGHGHSIPARIIYVIDRQVITRNYSGHQTFNIANLAGKATTQYVSRSYYPAGASDFSVLATKFAYASMRDIAFSSIREFYPDIAAHYVRKHREKQARRAAGER